jgi:hypothetical protein
MAKKENKIKFKKLFENKEEIALAKCVDEVYLR